MRHDLVAEVLAAVADPDIRLVVLTGEPGVGKSYVLDGIATELGADRAWGVRALADVPLAALAHLIPPAPTRIELIRNLLTRTEPVLCVDDLPECDALSQSLVHRLTLEPGRTVVATVRNESSLPHLEPLLDRPATRVIAVPTLTRAEADQLARKLLSGEPEVTLLDAIWERTNGNPLFASQLIASARSTGVLEMRDNIWVATSPLPVPPTLRDILVGRLDALDSAAREGVEYLAALGRVPVSRFERSHRADALARLVNAGIAALTRHGDDAHESAVVSHPLLAEIVWELVPADRRRDLLREHLAQELAEATPNHVRIAVLSLELDAEPPADALIPALRLASGGFDTAVVERFASAAASISQGDEFGEAVTAQVGALLQLGRVSDAAGVMSAALAKVRPGETAVRLALLQHELLLWGTGDRPAAAAALSAQRRRYPRFIRPVHEIFSVAEADGLVFAGRPGEALDTIDRRVRLRKRMRPELVDTRTHIRAHALAQLGRVAEAAAELGISADAAASASPIDAESPPALAGKALVLRSLILSVWGRPAEAAVVAQRAYQLAQDAGFQQGQSWSSLNVAYAKLHVGDLDGAAEWADRARRVSQDISLPACQRLAVMIHVITTASRGHRPDPGMLAVLASAPADGGFMLHQLAIAGAWAALTDDPDRATQIMTGALDRARSDGATLSEARILHEWIRMGRTGLADDLAALPQGYPLMEARLALARGVDSDNIALLREAAHRFAAHGMPLFAAEANELAALRSSPAQASALRNEARELLSTIGSVRTPLLRTLPELEALTRREFDIARRARTATSAQIAEELHLSVRTVENHLARIYRKLGVSSRGEIPADLTIDASGRRASSPVG